MTNEEELTGDTCDEHIKEAIQSQFRGMLNAFIKEFKPVGDNGGQ